MVCVCVCLFCVWLIVRVSGLCDLLCDVVRLVSCVGVFCSSCVYVRDSFVMYCAMVRGLCL